MLLIFCAKQSRSLVIDAAHCIILNERWKSLECDVTKHNLPGLFLQDSCSYDHLWHELEGGGGWGCC